MSANPAMNSRHSSIAKTVQSSIPPKGRKSLIQRACSSPSIISLYQESFIEPGSNADNSICTEKPPGIVSKKSPTLNHQLRKTTLQYNSSCSDTSSTSDLYDSHQDIDPVINIDNGSTTKHTIEPSRNCIKELAGEISNYYASVEEVNLTKTDRELDQKKDDRDTQSSGNSLSCDSQSLHKNDKQI